jgi:phenylacetate-CoA ligase
MQIDFDGYLKVLRQIEQGSAHHMVQYQRHLLARLTRFAHDHIAFYRDRLAGLFDRDGAVDWSRWSDVPVLSRDEAAAKADAMRPARLEDDYGEVTELQTSGSVGAPLRIASNQLAHAASNAAMTRMAQWWDVDTSQPLARLRIYKRDPPPYPDGRDGKGWSYAHPQADTHELDLMTPVVQQLEWLARKRAPYLITAPSNAAALAYAVNPQQARDLAIRLIFAVGETVLPGTRELVADRLGSRMAAVYSCEEVGTIATQCPASDGYHMVVENALVEVLREDGTSAAPGEIGRVVLTGFYNYAMPFIRYAIGDVAILAEGQCSCGRSLPMIAQVIGRTRCAFVFEDGTRIWPRGSDALAIRAFVPHREFQMVQLDRRRIEFRYVPESADQPCDLVGFDRLIRQRMHPSAEIRLAPMAAIPRGPGGKLESFISLVDA